MIRPIVPLVDHGVVERAVRLAAERQLDRRQLDHAVVAAEDTLEVPLERIGRDRRQEADPAEVDAEHRHAGAEEPRERAQHRPVAAEHDRDVRLGVVVHELHAEARGERAHALERRLD